MSAGPVAPPRRVLAEEFVKISTLWICGGSVLANVKVNLLLAGAARQFVSKPLAKAFRGAAIWSFVPDGLQAAVGGRIEGWCSVGIGWARTRPPVGEVAIFKFTL